MTTLDAAHHPSAQGPSLHVVLLALTIGLLSMALNVEEGMYARPAIILLAATIASLLAAIITSHLRGPRWLAPWVVPFIAGIISLHLSVLFWSRPGTWKNVNWRDLPTAVGPLSMSGKLPWPDAVDQVRKETAELRQKVAELGPKRTPKERNAILSNQAILNVTTFQGALLIIGTMFLAVAVTPGRVRDGIFIILIIAYAILGAWVIRTTPSPHIDVFVFQQESSDALLHGRNPYAITYRNIYGPGNYVYAPDLELPDGRLNFGYPYTPPGMLMAVPGYALFGDHRYSQLAAILLTALLLAFIGPGVIPKLAALLFLTTPRLTMVLECAWTEPFVVVLLAATIFCYARFPRAAPYVLGLFLSSKQYLLFAVPLVALLIPRPFTWRAYLSTMLKATLVACIVCLPLVLWKPAEFWRSAVTLQLKQPFRSDSLSFLAWWWHSVSKSQAENLRWLSFAAVIPAIALSLWKLPRTPAAFALALSFVYLAFFAFSKQAFLNYYFFVIGALCCALAARTKREGEAPAEPSRQLRDGSAGAWVCDPSPSHQSP